VFDVLPQADEITQAFGCTDNNAEWNAAWCPSRFYHSGVDLGSTKGGATLFRLPVLATRRGTVSRVGYPNGLGPFAVFLDLGNGLTAVYGHLDSTSVSVRQSVEVGQEIGKLGTRGNSTAPHLHLEIRRDGATQNVANNGAALVNPIPYLYKEKLMDTLPAGWKAESLGGQIIAGMTSLVMADGSLHIFVAGVDEKLYHFWYRVGQ
jgi:murein DD-endopeptidase MepM/ murein hydrolase activator NlpD